MSWDNQGGGGPWGNNGGSGGSGSPWGRGTGGQGGGQTPPDIDEIIRRGQAKLKGLLPKGFGGWKAGTLIALVLLGIWAANGFYRVQPNQERSSSFREVCGDYNKSRLTLELAGTNW